MLKKIKEMIMAATKKAPAKKTEPKKQTKAAAKPEEVAPTDDFKRGNEVLIVNIKLRLSKMVPESETLTYINDGWLIAEAMTDDQIAKWNKRRL